MTGADLTQARKDRHLTLLELSSRTGLSIADLAAIEVNESERLSQATTLTDALRRYAAALGLDTAAVLREYAPAGREILVSDETDSLGEFPSEGNDPRTSSPLLQPILDRPPEPVLELPETV